MHIRTLLLLSSFFVSIWLNAQKSDSTHTIQHRVIWQIGHNNVLDTYLSPFEYVGTTIGLQYHTLRNANFGKGRWQVPAHYSIYGSSLQTITHKGSMWTGQIRLNGGLLYRLLNGTHYLGLGFLTEGALGFSYLRQNGNNPAQAYFRTSINLCISHKTNFRFLHQRLYLHNELDIPSLGVAFSPEYGQSYYEMFGLKQRHKNFFLCHLINTPTIHISSLLTLPIGKTRWTIGYMGDIDQHIYHNISYHAWRHSFVIGYTRKFNLIR